MKRPLILPVIFLALCAFSCSGGSGGSDDAPADSDPVFGYVADDWVAQVFWTDMTDYWAEQGIAHTGKNYYLFTKPAGGAAHSRRFDPQSPYFQSWIGIYTVKDKNGKVYGMEDGALDRDAVIKLGIGDQTGWLRDFARISSPRVLIDETVPVTCEDATIDGEPGWKLTCRLLTQADVGEDNLQAGVPDLLTVPASCWESGVESYQEIMVDIVFYVWHSPENGELNMLYLTGAEFTDLDGVDRDYLPEILPELEEMARNVSVR